jgi:hypothetical protein
MSGSPRSRLLVRVKGPRRCEDAGANEPTPARARAGDESALRELTDRYAALRTARTSGRDG